MIEIDDQSRYGFELILFLSPAFGFLGLKQKKKGEKILIEFVWLIRK